MYIIYGSLKVGKISRLCKVRITSGAEAAPEVQPNRKWNSPSNLPVACTPSMPMAPAAAALLRWRRSTACGDSCPFWNIEKAKRFENAGKPHVFLGNQLIYQATRECQKHQGSLQRRVGGSQTLRGIFYVAIHHGKNLQTVALPLGSSPELQMLVWPRLPWVKI